MVEDTTLQIFLTVYHGQLIAAFLYDYIVRNSVSLYYQGLHWNLITNIAIGVIFILAIIWAILSVWGKVRRNLIICAIVLLVVFIIRLAIGIPDLMEKKRVYNSGHAYWSEFWVFVVQMVVHAFGIVATWILAQKS